MTRSQLYFSCGLVIATGAAINLAAWLWLDELLPDPKPDLAALSRAACHAVLVEAVSAADHPQGRRDAICGCVAQRAEAFAASSAEDHSTAELLSGLGAPEARSQATTFISKATEACDAALDWPPLEAE